MAATDLFDLCAEWLACIADALATTPGGPIERAFVSAGPPAFDCCPQLTVHAGGPAESDTAPLSPPLAVGQRATQGALHLVNLAATVVRCADTIDEDGNLPSPLSLETTANETMADVWAIWNYTRQRHASGLLFPSPGGRRELVLEPAVVVNTQGGCAGWVVPIRVQLGGYKISS